MFLPIFQFAVEIDPNALSNLTTNNPQASIFVWWVVGGLCFLLIFFIAFRILKWYLYQNEIIPEKYRKVILKIQLPKVGSGEDMNSEKNVQQIREGISVTETIFSSIGGLKADKGIRNWLYGRNDDIAFEVVFQDGKIQFYVAVPAYLQGYLEQQIHGQYAEANIEQVIDYNIFDPKSVIVGSYLTFKREYIFPIKTYEEINNDPLNAILNTFNKFEEHEGAAIQYMIRSADKSWHNWGVKAVSKMYQGTKMKDAIKATNPSFFTKFFHEFWGLFKSSKKKDELGSTEETHKLSSREEEAAKGIEQKSSKAGLDVNIRIIVASTNQAKAEMRLNDINNSYSQFNIYEYGNSFRAQTGVKLKHLVRDFIHRQFNETFNLILNTEEMASLYHFPLSFTEVQNIDWMSAKKSPPPLNVSKEGLIVGKNIYRGKQTLIKIKKEDRRRHMYIIGMTGTGKSYFSAGLALQDIIAGNGVCVIDPHGDLIDDLLAHTPKERAEDIILVDPSNTDRPMGLNMLEYETEEQKLFVVDTILQVFDKLYDLKATGGPMFEQYMRNTLLLIMDDPDTGMTLADVSKVLADEDYRKLKLSKCKTPVVKNFWEKEAEKAGGEASLQNMVPYITSKLTPFIANDLMRPIISQEKSSFSFRDAMDNQKIILVKLSKGKIGDLNANLLGMIVINKLLMAALGRADMDEADRKDFYLYIDEFQNFLTDSIEIILSEARKYRLALIIAHQYLGQLVKGGDTKFKDAIFGNVGTKIGFRIGVDDAETLAKEFAPVFSEYDFLNVPKYNTFCKLLIDNANPPAFNMATFPFSEFADENVEQGKIIAELSSLKYGRDRKAIEEQVVKRDEIIEALIQNQKKQAKLKEKKSAADPRRSLRPKP